MDAFYRFCPSISFTEKAHPSLRKQRIAALLKVIRTLHVTWKLL